MTPPGSQSPCSLVGGGPAPRVAKDKVPAPRPRSASALCCRQQRSALPPSWEVSGGAAGCPPGSACRPPGSARRSARGHRPPGPPPAVAQSRPAALVAGSRVPRLSALLALLRSPCSRRSCRSPGSTLSTRRTSSWPRMG